MVFFLFFIKFKYFFNRNSETGVLNWMLTELSKHGECSGSLKARLKLTNGSSIPTITSVQFQVIKTRFF